MRLATTRLVILISLLLLIDCPAILAQGRDGDWSSPVNVSGGANDRPMPAGDAWFPDLAVDRNERVHMVWSDTRPLSGQDMEETDGLPERVYYSVGKGRSWSDPNDIIQPNREIIRSAIAVDRDDLLHMVYRYRSRGLGTTAMYYTQAPAGTAWSATSWSPGQLINARGQSYMADLAIDSKGVLHLIFDDIGDIESEICPVCADIYYRRSADNGRTWSAPKNLGAMPLGASREQIEIGADDTIHVTWDEGWDRITGRGDPTYGVYTFSTDGGDTWQSPMKITDPTVPELSVDEQRVRDHLQISPPDPNVAQLAVGADDEQGALLVWRIATGESHKIYYQWSRDQGETWTEPAAIPDIFARLWLNPFDMYDMDTDSLGHIHLVVVGRLSEERDAALGVYHLRWNGRAWSDPVAIYEREDSPEYPKIVVNRGNQLHVTWFTRPEEEGIEPYAVWYSHKSIETPEETPIPPSTPTPVPEPTADTSEPVPTATPPPTLPPDLTPLPGGIQTEYDELLRVAIGLAPVLLIVTIILVFRKRRR